MSEALVLVQNATPIVTIEASEAITVDNQSVVTVETRPDIIEVKWLSVTGAPGSDGRDADFTDPQTVADMLSALSGQVTSSLLHSNLLNSIEKIDVGPTSLEAQTAILQYADEQLNASIAQDSLRISAAESSITAIDGQLILFGSDLSTLDGRVTGNSAAIDSIETRVTANEADLYTQAQTIQGISSRVDIAESDLSAQAAIVNQNTTAISSIDGELTSTAETLSTITAGVGGMAAAIQLKNEVIAGTATPLYAQNTVKLDVNGKISGYGLASTETASIFEILADRFAVTNGLNNGIIPFLVDGANVYIQNGFIQNAAIDSAQIADAAITNAKIEDATIDVAKIKDATITAAKIANATITAAKIALATIEAAQIKDATITGAKIATAAIDSAQIKDAAITSAKILDASIVNGDIANATITGAKIASATIGEANIGSAAITTAKIADANITTAKIGDAQVSTLKIGGNAVTLPVGGTSTAKIASASWQDLVSLTFTCVGQPVLMNASVKVKVVAGSTAGNYNLRLLYNSTTVFETGICTVYGSTAAPSTVIALAGLTSVTAASHTFKLQGLGDPGASAKCDFPAGSTLICTELRR